MKIDLLRIRQALRSPGTSVLQLARQAETTIRSSLRHRGRALLSFRKSVASLTNRNWPDLDLWPWQTPPPVVPAKMPSGQPWPKISIVPPAYQQGEFIERTSRSVLLQGYPNLEYIVVDGGSTDTTQAVLRRYASELDVCISEADQGQADAINKGFQRSTGEILGWLNSDDMHLPSTLVEVALAFAAAKALGFTYPIDLVCGKALLYSENHNAIVNEH